MDLERLARHFEQLKEQEKGVDDYLRRYERRGITVSRTYDGMMIAIPAPHWALFRALSHQEFASALHELASSVDLSKYQKHPRGPKKRPPERAPYQNGQHVATAKLLAQR